MKYYIFEGRIEFGEGLQKLLDFIGNNEGELLIGIDSIGGSATIGELLLNILNLNKERVTLQCLNGVYSTAFYLFAEFEGKKLLAENSKGMWHYGKTTICIDDKGNPFDGEDEVVKSSNKYRKAFSGRIAKKYMNEKELQKFKKGEDVYFGYERMREMFTKTKTNRKSGDLTKS